MRRVLGPAVFSALSAVAAASCALTRDVDALSKDYDPSLGASGQPSGSSSSSGNGTLVETPGGSSGSTDAALDTSAFPDAAPCGGSCPANTYCNGTTCTPCGEINQSCCPVNACRAGTCIGGTCKGCGTAIAGDNYCCGGNICNGPPGVLCCGGLCTTAEPFKCCSNDAPRCKVCCATCTNGTTQKVIAPDGNCDAAARNFCQQQNNCGGGQAAACCPDCTRENVSGWKDSCP